MGFLKSRFACTTVIELTFINLTYLGIRNNDKNTIDSCPHAALNRSLLSFELQENSLIVLNIFT